MADQAAKLISLTCEETGRIGGLTRARKLSPEQRRESAQRAARARWAKKHSTPDPPGPPDPNGPHRDVQCAEAGIMSTPRRRPVVSASSANLSGSGRAA